MPDAAHDIGEVWGKVESLEQGVASLLRRIDDGLTKLNETIERNNDRMNARLNETTARTDTRFEEIARQNLAQLGRNTSQQWQAFTYIGATVLGVASLGVTLWTLTKTPIDANFARHDADITGIAEGLKKFEDKVADKAELTRDRQDALYVPRAEINIMRDTTVKNTARIDDLEKAAAVSVTDRTGIHDDIKDVKDAEDRLRRDQVPRPENENRFADLQERVNKLFDRLNIVQSDLSAGNSVGSRINTLAQDLEALKSKFIVVPRETVKTSP